MNFEESDTSLGKQEVNPELKFKNKFAEEK